MDNKERLEEIRAKAKKVADHWLGEAIFQGIEVVLVFDALDAAEQRVEKFKNIAVEKTAQLIVAEVRADDRLMELERLREYVTGIIPYLERHLQEVKACDLFTLEAEIGYIDCLGALKNALYEASQKEV